MADLTDLTGALGWEEVFGPNQGTGGAGPTGPHQVHFEYSGDPDRFTGTYLDPAHDGSVFDVRLFSTPRGIVLTLVQDGQNDSYLATACGHLHTRDDGHDEVTGFYVDVDNNQWQWTMTRNVPQP